MKKPFMVDKMPKEILPQEIEVWYIIPAIRREFVKSLVKEMSQKKAAEMLDLTEPAVSQYLKNKRGSEIEFNEKIMEMIEKSVKNIKKGDSVLGEIQEVIKVCRKEKLLCKLHREHCEFKFPEKCKICGI
ncbi:MAG: transcriptional regulator [Candidatus Aenigmarchaeota archaeon]|nr:transcriptional regulator [Candidatus Aenigmarchaeota archaeon]